MDSITEQNIWYHQKVIEGSIALTVVAILVSAMWFNARCYERPERNMIRYITWNDALIMPGLCSIINSVKILLGYSFDQLLILGIYRASCVCVV